MRVFVTGNRGYIGVHLVDLLREAGHQVTGCDLGLFEGCEWEPLPEPDVQLSTDVRQITLTDLDGHDAVCHLAAISNDPMGELDPRLTSSVNRDASIRLATLAKRAGVERFLFSGSCSVYGKGAKPTVDEADPLNPLTAYARSKTETEVFLTRLADDVFSPILLRNATAYGHSAMFRLDLVVNNLLACAVAYNKIRIMSDGMPWRPLVHCRDIARAFVALLEAPRELVHNQIINIGADHENYRVKDVADLVGDLVPQAEIEYTGEVGADPRDYRVGFDKLRRLLPKFSLAYNLPAGMRELHGALLHHGFTAADFEGNQFVRLRTLRNRLYLLTPRALAAPSAVALAEASERSGS
jgi:nucleoside-diphosphate-sugar epimerase